MTDNAIAFSVNENKNANIFLIYSIWNAFTYTIYDLILFTTVKNEYIHILKQLFGKRLTIILVDNYFNNKSFNIITRRWGLGAIYKYSLFNQEIIGTTQYNKILYLDIDTTIKNCEINDIFNINFNNCGICLAIDTGIKKKHIMQLQDSLANANLTFKYNPISNEFYGNTGVILVNSGYFSDLTKFNELININILASNIKYADQDSINIVLGQNMIQLPQKFNKFCKTYIDMHDKNAVVMHHCGKYKPFLKCEMRTNVIFNDFIQQNHIVNFYESIL